jgi:hypothetical protein
LYSVDVEFSTVNVSEVFIRRPIATRPVMAAIAIGPFQTVSKELS